MMTIILEGGKCAADVFIRCCHVKCKRFDIQASKRYYFEIVNKTENFLLNY